MAAATGVEDAFGAVFGEAKPEGDPAPRPILFRAHACSATAALRVVATDCYSLAWDRSLSVADLDDLRDDVGIGGSWSDFLDYLKSSLSSGDVRLLFAADQLRESPGPHGAKLVATKAKGLPRIAISLHSVTGAAVRDVVAEFSLALYAAYRTTQEDASREKERMSQLMGSLSSERVGTLKHDLWDAYKCLHSAIHSFSQNPSQKLQHPGFSYGPSVTRVPDIIQEKNEIMQKQLEALSFLDKRKATKQKLVTDQVPSVSGVTLGSDQVTAPVQQQISVASSSKVPPAKATKRAAPISRRARVRGALLQDTDENDENS